MSSINDALRKAVNNGAPGLPAGYQAEAEHFMVRSKAPVIWAVLGGLALTLLAGGGFIFFGGGQKKLAPRPPLVASRVQPAPDIQGALPEPPDTGPEPPRARVEPEPTPPTPTPPKKAPAAPAPQPEPAPKPPAAPDRPLPAPAPKPEPVASPDEAAAHFARASLAAKAKDFDTAVWFYRQAIEADYDFADAYLNLGNIYLYQFGSIKKAQEMYNHVLRIDPQNKLGHNNIGVIFLRRDLLDQARAEFATALRIDPDFVDAHYNMACALARQSKGQKALKSLERAAALDPLARRWAANDNDLKTLAGQPGFEAFLRAGQP